MNSTPSVLGLKRSFGFGDRLGLATPGHIEAARGSGFAPVFAQQSIRELARTRREPKDVMKAAADAVAACGWEGSWGADADHLQTREDVFGMAEAGFTMFTIDPSVHVNKDADNLAGAALEAAVEYAAARCGMTARELRAFYADKTIELDAGLAVSFRDPLALARAIAKYGAALAHTRQMAGWIREACGNKNFEIEMSVDETPHPTTPLEHAYVALELRRMGVAVISLAPRFTGNFEKGVDYKGDLAAFERDYRLHVAIARHCGPYKISIHSGSDKFAIYPVAGRLSGELLHVKTAGTSYLEALRVVCRTDMRLFREITEYCRSRYETDKASYHVSASLQSIPARIEDKDMEHWFLENNAGRQILHVTFGSVLTQGKSSSGAAFKTLIIENLVCNEALYREVLRKHLGKHLQLLRG